MEDLKESLAKNRSRRSNAGANMSRLLDKEEEDDFYKTSYGGFMETEDDNDFSMSDSSDSENVIDSDFDCDENADANPEDDGEKEEKQLQKEEKLERQAAFKRKTVYREPIVKKSSPEPQPSSVVKDTATSSAQIKTVIRTGCRGRPRTIVTPRPPLRKTAALRSNEDTSMYKNLRESTKKMSRETKENLEDERRRKLKSKKRWKRKNYQQPTQEERLREAKKTERENMRSLEAYKNLEIEKSKRNKITKKIPNVPMIRYYSYTDQVESNDDGKNQEPCHRTIISFPNEDLFDRCFGRYKRTADTAEIIPHKRNVSALSNLPIRYKDPLTEFPYAKATEFSIIRDQYVRYLEQSLIKDDPSVKRFLEANRAVNAIKVTISEKKISNPSINNLNSGSSSTNVLANDYQDFIKYRTFRKADDKSILFVITTNKDKGTQLQQVSAAVGSQQQTSQQQETATSSETVG